MALNHPGTARTARVERASVAAQAEVDPPAVLAEGAQELLPHGLQHDVAEPEGRALALDPREVLQQRDLAKRDTVILAENGCNDSKISV
jgi:hypothetical protein